MQDHADDAAAEADLPKAEQVRQTAYDQPWLTHQQIAAVEECSRSYVSDILGDAPEVQAVREAFRKGMVAADPAEAKVRGLANIFEQDVGDAVAERLREAAADDEVAEVRIEVRTVGEEGR